MHGTFIKIDQIQYNSAKLSKHQNIDIIQTSFSDGAIKLIISNKTTPKSCTFENLKTHVNLWLKKLNHNRILKII